jgi:hypothetical protein
MMASRWDRDINPGPHEYEGVLTTRPRRSVDVTWIGLHDVISIFVYCSYVTVYELDILKAFQFFIRWRSYINIFIWINFLVINMLLI